MSSELASEPTKEEALELLARRLFEKMELVDPSDGPGDWDALTEHDRQVYRACTNALLQERKLARIALG